MANEIKVELDLDTLEAIKELGAFAKKSQVAGEKAGSSFAKSFGASLLGNIGADLVGKALRSIGNEFGKLTNLESLEVKYCRCFIEEHELRKLIKLKSVTIEKWDNSRYDFLYYILFIVLFIFVLIIYKL